MTSIDHDHPWWFPTFQETLQEPILRRSNRGAPPAPPGSPGAEMENGGMIMWSTMKHDGGIIYHHMHNIYIYTHVYIYIYTHTYTSYTYNNNTVSYICIYIYILYVYYVYISCILYHITLILPGCFRVVVTLLSFLVCRMEGQVKVRCKS